MKKKNVITASVFVCLLLVTGSLTLFNIFVTAPGTADEPASKGVINDLVMGEKLEYATITPVVYDGETGLPIEGAAVVIPEIGEPKYTGEDGRTEPIEVPIIQDDRFDNLVEKPWGEVTILVYKDGYAPYALFYVEVFAKEDRQGPAVFMYQEGSEREQNQTEPFSLIEGPNRFWVQDMIDKYQP